MAILPTNESLNQTSSVRTIGMCLTDDQILQTAFPSYLYDPMNVWRCRSTRSRDSDGNCSVAKTRTLLLLPKNKYSRICKKCGSKERVKSDIPKRNSLPPPIGDPTTACADRGPGQVGETNLRHSSCRVRVIVNVMSQNLMR